MGKWRREVLGFGGKAVGIIRKWWDVIRVDSDAQRWCGRSVTQISDEKLVPERAGNTRDVCGWCREVVGFRG